jgi:alginate O-acetyltransferase complex protein AlgI
VAVAGWTSAPGRPAAGQRSAAVRIAACAATFIAVTSAWVLFRAPSFALAGAMLAAMYGLDGGETIASLEASWNVQWSLLTDLRWSESSAIWLLLVGCVAFILPNTYQLFQVYRPALVEPRFEAEMPKPRFGWNPNWRWALGLSLMLLSAILQIHELSPFIYFQF